MEMFRNKDKGQGMVEYGLLLGLISAVTIGALGGIGDGTNKVFDKASEPDIIAKIDQGYIPIASADELGYIREETARTFGKGTSWEGTYTAGLDKKFIQVTEIDLSTIDSWEPIDSFAGTYDGSGLSISNLTIDSDEHLAYGLFGETKGASLTDIHLDDVFVRGSNAVGGLVGKASEGSTIENSFVSGELRHSGATDDLDASLGGVAGELSDQSKLSKSHVDVRMDGKNNVGGLVGQAKGSSLSNVYAHGVLSGDDSAGGLVGTANSNSTVDQSYAAVKIISEKGLTGGLIGNDRGVSVNSSYWDIDTSGIKETAGNKGEGQSTFDMTLARTFKGWDFDNIWKVEEGETYPSFDGENKRLYDVTVTFTDDDGAEYPVNGLIGATLNDYHEGEIPELEKESHSLVGWETEKGKAFGLDTKLEGKDFKVKPVWELNEISVTFRQNNERDYVVKGLIGSTINESYEGAVPEPVKDGHTFSGWETEQGKDFDLDTVLGDKDFTVSPKWKLNEIVTKTFILDEEGSQEQIKNVTVDNLYEVTSYDVDEGKVDMVNQTGDDLTFKLSNRGYDRRVQTGGEEILADRKEVSAQTSSYYNSGGYSGSLSQYVYSGSLTPSDTKYVSGQTSSWYNSGGYSGSLSQYLAGGSYTPSDSKTISNYSERRVLLEEHREGWYYDSLGNVAWGSAGNGQGWTTVGSAPSSTMYYSSGGYYGTLRRVGSTNRDFNWDPQPNNPYPGQYWINGRNWGTYSYSGTVTRSGSDTRYWRYRGNVTRPASDSRVYRYRGSVNRPYSDTRTWDNFYKYAVTVSYREK